MNRYFTNKDQTEWYFQKLNEIGVVIGRNHEAVCATPDSRTRGYTVSVGGLQRVGDFNCAVDEMIEKFPPKIEIFFFECFDRNDPLQIMEMCEILERRAS